MPAKTKKHQPAKKKKVNLPITEASRPAPEFFSQRRRLMWLGVGISALVIFLLWLFSWQINFPIRPVQSQPSESETSGLVSEFKQAIDEAKSSLNNIGQLIDQAKPADSAESADEATEKLKTKIMDQLEEQSAETASSPTDNNGGKIIIFE